MRTIKPKQKKNQPEKHYFLFYQEAGKLKDFKILKSKTKEEADKETLMFITYHYSELKNLLLEFVELYECSSKESIFLDDIYYELEKERVNRKSLKIQQDELATLELLQKKYNKEK